LGINVGGQNGMAVITIDEIREITTPILASYPVEKAVLFGSYAKNNASKNSDIDMYIDTNGELKGLNFVGLLEVLVNALGVDVDLFDKSHIEPGAAIIREIEREGVVVYEKS